MASRGSAQVMGSGDLFHTSTPFIYPISGANILVGAFTVTVIAIDRWKSVANTNPNSAPLNYTRAFAVIAAVWLLAFLGEKTVPSLLII